MLRVISFALALCCAGPAAALCSGESFTAQLSDADKAEIAASTAAIPYAEGLLWTLTRDDATLTIVGTMHIYDERLQALHARIQPTLAQADLLMVEATSAEETAMQEAFVADPSLYLITDGPTLPTLLEPEAWEKVQTAARDRGLPSFMVAQMQPWYLSLTLSIPGCAMAELASGQRGLDHMLMQDAISADIPLQALESWEALIDTLSDSTLEEQLSALEMSLIPKADQEALFVAMLDAYFAEDTATVWTIGAIAARMLTDLTPEEAEAQMAETQEVLLDQRNIAWVPVIEAAIADEANVVVAVGAAHLPGEFGLLRLLEAEGWRVSPLD